MDVAREGPPSNEGQLAPVERAEEGVQLGDALPGSLDSNEPVQHQAPQVTPPIPHGILPVPSEPTPVPPAPLSSGPSSRRSSTQEPHSEPDMPPVTLPPPGLEAIREEEEEGTSSGGELKSPQLRLPGSTVRSQNNPARQPPRLPPRKSRSLGLPALQSGGCWRISRDRPSHQESRSRGQE